MMRYNTFFAIITLFALILPASAEEFATTATTTPNDRTVENPTKPTFEPYCVARDACQPVCDCASRQYCEVLDMNAVLRVKITTEMNTARSIRTKDEPQQASGMPMLLYDPELEEISRCWSARCENGRSDCFRTPSYAETAQMVGVSPFDPELSMSEVSSDYYWDKTIQIWLEEAKKTNAETLLVSTLPVGKEDEEIAAQSNAPIILSDKALRVGCAWSRSSTADGAASFLVFVCTLAPVGPRPDDEPLYKTGQVCTQCPEDYRCDFKEPFEYLCKDRNISVEHIERLVATRRHDFDDYDYDEEGPTVARPATAVSRRGAGVGEPEPPEGFSASGGGLAVVGVVFLTISTLVLRVLVV